MAFKSLAHFVRSLEENRELLRISGFVSPRLEITEIADRMVKNGGKALLFENTGTDFPLLINMFASDRRICMALGVNSLDDIERDIASLLKEFLGPKKGFMEKLMILPSLKEVVSWMPKSSNHRGACQEVVMEKPDLSRLPVPTCWFAGRPACTPSVNVCAIEMSDDFGIGAISLEVAKNASGMLEIVAFTFPYHGHIPPEEIVATGVNTPVVAPI